MPLYRLSLAAGGLSAHFVIIEHAASSSAELASVLLRDGFVDGEERGGAGHMLAGQQSITVMRDHVTLIRQIVQPGKERLNEAGSS